MFGCPANLNKESTSTSITIPLSAEFRYDGYQIAVESLPDRSQITLTAPQFTRSDTVVGLLAAASTWCGTRGGYYRASLLQGVVYVTVPLEHDRSMRGFHAFLQEIQALLTQNRRSRAIREIVTDGQSLHLLCDGPTATRAYEQVRILIDAAEEKRAEVFLRASAWCQEV